MDVELGDGGDLVLNPGGNEEPVEVLKNREEGRGFLGSRSSSSNNGSNDRTEQTCGETRGFGAFLCPEF